MEFLLSLHLQGGMYGWEGGPRFDLFPSFEDRVGRGKAPHCLTIAVGSWSRMSRRDR